MAQVSMNLTDFEQTPVHRVFEMVKREAARYGVMPVSSEIVGTDSEESVGVGGGVVFAGGEFRFVADSGESTGCGDGRQDGGWRTARRGRAVRGATGGADGDARRRQRGRSGGAMAAGLAHMVASMSRGKKAYLQYESELSEAIARLSQLREELKAAIDADAESYNAVMKAYKQAKEVGDGDAIIDAALKQATSVPLGVAERAREVGDCGSKLEPITNPNMKSDLTTASALARAAIEGALANVEINLESMKDAEFVARPRRKSAAALVNK